MQGKYTFEEGDVGRQVWAPSGTGKGWIVGTVQRNPDPEAERLRRPFIVILERGARHLAMFSFINPNAHKCMFCIGLRGNHTGAEDHRFREAEGSWLVQGIAKDTDLVTS